jgi:hypothetical protein
MDERKTQNLPDPTPPKPADKAEGDEETVDEALRQHEEKDKQKKAS